MNSSITSNKRSGAPRSIDGTVHTEVDPDGSPVEVYRLGNLEMRQRRPTTPVPCRGQRPTAGRNESAPRAAGTLWRAIRIAAAVVVLFGVIAGLASANPMAAAVGGAVLPKLIPSP